MHLIVDTELFVEPETGRLRLLCLGFVVYTYAGPVQHTSYLVHWRADVSMDSASKRVHGITEQAMAHSKNQLYDLLCVLSDQLQMATAVVAHDAWHDVALLLNEALWCRHLRLCADLSNVEIVSTKLSMQYECLIYRANANDYKWPTLQEAFEHATQHGFLISDGGDNFVITDNQNTGSMHTQPAFEAHNALQDAPKCCVIWAFLQTKKTLTQCT